MTRSTLLFAVVAFVLVALTSVLEVAGLPVAAFVALLFGVLAGRTAHAAGLSAVRAGAGVGLGALLGAIVGMVVPALIAGNMPAVQAFVQASEPHPEARIATDLIAPLAGLTGVLVGGLLGTGYLIVAIVGGLIGRMLVGRNRAIV